MVELLVPKVAGSQLENGVVKFSAVSASKCKPVTTQPNFDLKKYISKPWYVQQQMETEYLPQSWNYCLGAKYTMKEKNTFWGYMIQVRNVAREEDGTVHDSNSLLCAYSADKTDPAKLGVAPCFLPTVLTGDYWVIAYDEEEGYAIISGGQPTFETDNGCTTGEGTNDAGLWLFTRQQERNEALVEKMRGIAEAKGFDLAVLNDIDNTACDAFPDSVWG
jgi:lipocalin